MALQRFRLTREDGAAAACHAQASRESVAGPHLRLQAVMFGNCIEDQSSSNSYRNGCAQSVF